MGQHVAAEVVKLMIHKGHAIAGARVLVLGFTFKENCPDLRNTRVIDLVRELQGFGARVDVYDPWADGAEARHEYAIDLLVVLRRDHEAVYCGNASKAARIRTRIAA